MLYTLDGKKVSYTKTSFIAPTAVVIGDAHIAENASVWFNAVIRGDTDALHVGRSSNVQDNCVLHTDEGIAMVIGEGVTIGHSCVIHGCIIGDNSLIGMGATILNNAKIGSNCIIGANTLVTQGMIIADNSLALGSPAKVIRQLSAEEIEKNRANAQIYVDRGRQYLTGLALQSSEN